MTTLQVSDAQRLAFVQAQAFKVNQTVYETKYPDWDFSRLIFVDTSGPEWSPGIMTYTSDMSGVAKWQSGAAKDVPVADVSQDMQTKAFYLAAIGYDWNIEEVNSAIQINGTLADRRARAARLAYTKFMYDITVKGNAEKGVGGLINYAGVTATDAAGDGTGSATFWVNAAGVGLKTPAQIVRDINIALMGVYNDTYNVEMADTILLPVEAMVYMSQTPYSATTMETIASFVQRTNIYTLTTGRPLTMRTIRELGTQAAGAKGRLVAYKNDANDVRLHLPMPHKFLPVWQNGPMQWTVPGIFRTGGVELMSKKAFRYLDLISEPPA